MKNKHCQPPGQAQNDKGADPEKVYRSYMHGDRLSDDYVVGLDPHVDPLGTTVPPSHRDAVGERVHHQHHLTCQTT
jgi:hypothetical protein